MAKFVLLEEEDRSELFNKAKENTNNPLNKLPLLLEISRTSFFNYYSKGLPIPLNVFVKLKELAGLKTLKYKIIEKSRFLRNEITIPELNELLAEIIGALNGDGHLSKYKYEVNIVSDYKEKKYQEYMKGLFKEVFDIIPSSIRMKNNAIKMRVYSIDLHKHLSEEYGLPIGKKKGSLKIPQRIKESEDLLKAYIKGLFDTDGSFYLRREKEPVIEITSADKNFLEEIMEALTSLNFNVAKGTKRTFIYRKKEVKKFFKMIKPANHKHLKKFENFSKQYAWVV